MADPLHLGPYLQHPSLGFERTGRFFVLGLGAPMASAPEAPSPGEEVAARIGAVGDEIRKLKASKASKELVMRKVEELNQLKSEYEKVTGRPYAAPGLAGKPYPGKAAPAGKTGKGKAAPAAAAEDPTVAARRAVKFAAVRSVGEECVTEADLETLLKLRPDSFRLYDGFEPSGRMHIAQGIFKAINVNKCTEAGGTFVFWVADWFALMNDKMGGDLDKIKDVGQYFVEVWRAAGMDMSKVEFRWASEDITKNAATYWPQMLDIARRFTLARITKCCTIMGRAEGNLTAAQILYPIMQCTDVFFLRADVCQLGVDQRKVNMLAREYCDAAGLVLKPVILSHHMLYGLKQGQAKMSKSDPDSAIFMEDSEGDIARKLGQAYCPREAKGGAAPSADGELRLVVDDLENPCLDYVKHIVLSPEGATFTAGGATYTTYEAVKAAFLEGALSEEALKAGLVTAVDALVAPVRKHFAENLEARALLGRITGYKKEDAAAQTSAAKSKPLRRHPLLKPLLGGGTPPEQSSAGGGGPCVVFAPLPTAHCPLGLCLTLLRRIRAGLAAAPEGKAVLWLPDWSALVLSSLGGDTKAIRAAYTLLVESLRALDALQVDPSKRVMMGSRLQVVWQSEAVLQGPSDYWISVIDVGRALKLNQVQMGFLPLPSAAASAAASGEASGEAASGESATVSADGKAGETEAAAGGVPGHAPSEAAGRVVSALMHCGDVLGCHPSVIPCSQGADEAPHKLALGYWASARVAARNGLPPPVLLRLPAVSTWLSKDRPPGSGQGFSAASSDDEYLVGDDPKGGANKKMKRAFCEPGNVENNPPLAVARDVLLELLGKVEVDGKVFSGSDAFASMRQAFAADELTPQALKPAVTQGVALVLDTLNDALKASPEAKKADAALKQWLKASQPKKGGKQQPKKKK
eukprot:CAMPEP_0172581694 /NCGR_PEP_ID=MMETSP1068-20121228/992_1 /TAXON_ID=35684 /ORGANISM="Pseudopedinella elastica, Strain CCMP716" /LENGTH=919 /DNA_ID=CAMNT_0013374779 /DNA_START=63 /DNA_END=2822 /DNA_ORIENTATION=-